MSRLLAVVVLFLSSAVVSAQETPLVGRQTLPKPPNRLGFILGSEIRIVHTNFTAGELHVFDSRSFGSCMMNVVSIRHLELVCRRDDKITLRSRGIPTLVLNTFDGFEVTWDGLPHAADPDLRVDLEAALRYGATVEDVELAGTTVRLVVYQSAALEIAIAGTDPAAVLAAFNERLLALRVPVSLGVGNSKRLEVRARKGSETLRLTVSVTGTKREYLFDLKTKQVAQQF